MKIRGSSAFQGFESYGDGGDFSEADELSTVPGYLTTAGHGARSAAATSGGFLLTYQNLRMTGDRIRQGIRVCGMITTIALSGTTYTETGDFVHYDTTSKAIAGASGTVTITANKILMSLPGS